MKRSPRRLTVLLGGFALAIATLAVTIGPASAIGSTSSASCGITWGSLPKPATFGTGYSPGAGVGGVTSVRAGRHDCYDRVVFDGQTGFNQVSYVAQVTRDGSGQVVPLQGGAFLQVSFTTPSNRALFHGPFPSAAGFQTLRQVASAGGFEGYESYGIGVRARLPFRVFTLDPQGPHPRVVVDIAHKW